MSSPAIETLAEGSVTQQATGRLLIDTKGTGLYRHHRRRRALGAGQRRPAGRPDDPLPPHVRVPADPGERRSGRARSIFWRRSTTWRRGMPATSTTRRGRTTCRPISAAMLTATSLEHPRLDGQMVLGTWQGIYLARASRPAAHPRYRVSPHRRMRPPAAIRSQNHGFPRLPCYFMTVPAKGSRRLRGRRQGAGPEYHDRDRRRPSAVSRCAAAGDRFHHAESPRDRGQRHGGAEHRPRPGARRRPDPARPHHAGRSGLFGADDPAGPAPGACRWSSFRPPRRRR